MRLFILDIDGTLTDSVDVHQSAFMQAFSSVGINEVDSNWAAYKHHTDSWIFGEVFRTCFRKDPEAPHKDDFVSAFLQHFDDALVGCPLREIPGAASFVARAQSSPDAAYAFATGSFRHAALKKIAAIGIQFPLELLVTADEFESREEIIAHAIAAAERLWGVTRFDRVVSVGDGHWDLVAARNVGVEFTAIARGAQAEAFRVAGASRIFPDFWGLIEEGFRTS